MIQLTLQWIKTYAGNDRKFKSGFMIHQKNNILSIEASSKNGFHILLKDLKDEQFELYLSFYSDTGTFKNARCTCYDVQPCIHTLAALLYILYKKESLTLDLTQNQTLKMFQSFEQVLFQPTTSNQLTLLNLEVTLHPKDAYHKTLQSAISLKVGLYQTYVVKNIESFVYAVMEKHTYELSKTLTYDSESFGFTDEDYKLIALLYDFYKTRLFLLPKRQSLVSTPIKASYQILPDTYLKRLLELLKNKSFHLDYDGMLFKDQDIIDHLEIDLYLTDDAGHYIISVNAYDIYFPLTEDYSFAFYNNQISSLSAIKADAFKLFYTYFSDKSLDIQYDHLHNVMNQILPVLEMVGYVTLEPTIAQKILRYPLESKIYLDKNHDQLKLRAYFIYGPHEFGLYPEIDPDLGDQIVFRQLNIEQRILQLLKDTPHAIDSQGFLTYASEDDQFYFIDQILPKLQKLGTLYYSDSFKDTYLKSEKQLSASIAYKGSSNLLDLSFEMEGISQDEIFILLKAIVEKKRYFKLSDGSFFKIQDALAHQMSVLDSHYPIINSNQGSSTLSLPGHHAFFLDHLMSSTQTVHYNQAYKKLLNAIQNPENYFIEVPKPLDAILRDYQKTGYRWLSALTSYGLGGILADDMGLGKTLQAITLMTSHVASLPSLVIAPTSLLYNWEEEVRKFAPNQKTIVVSGSKNERIEQIESLCNDVIIITSYGALKRDLHHYKQTFMFCIIDEAQHIKNPKSQNAIAVKHINALHRFALTGTPIENTLTELWSIFDFILPGFLGSASYFAKTYERPITKDNNHHCLKQLNQMIAPFILRRIKQDVLKELPPKIETKVTIELNKHQKKIYMAYIEKAKMEMESFKYLSGGQKNMKILSILMRLRQICCHPSLFIDQYTHGSSKMDLLLELVMDSIESGHRMLIFSQFTSMLGMIQTLLDKHKIESYYLDGSVPPNKRQEMVHDFNTGFHSVFLISLKAGGTGLNLTGADVVIHVDPWWNPAVENQATDRVYRIGQKKCVQVYKLITAGTIEEKIFTLQQKKQNLIEHVIKPGETFINKLSAHELQNLFDSEPK
ncbi:DEAD/DEAH box helicase [Petrocella sp. FN5]|uniref:DEAD/DEAH box helicase n=1 Tax=Petrocella sp. FN5 TaxID=3032002 RepID=UPI0023DB19B1|nr:DEAD/DEAH box helicase [Petrocella sp. FN5]MDF1616688.1 DEAD/DEAH box helicase [Petrocella sp. FN5]